MVDLGEVVLEANDIEKYFGRTHVLRGVSLAVRRHETVTIIGRSGSGKTTLLRCLNFLEEPTVGQVRLVEADLPQKGSRWRRAVTRLTRRRESLAESAVGHDRLGDVIVDANPLQKRDRSRHKDIRQIRRHVGMVFQDFNLFPHMTVLENCIEAPIHVNKVPRKQAIEIAERYLEKVHLTDKRDEYPARMSGGQKQRAAIARALSMEPQVLLFDEPTSALDPELIGEVIVVMEQLAHEGATMIVVSHEMAFAREAADRVIYLDEGVIVEEGPPEQVLDDPREESTQQFLRRFLSEGAKAPTAAEPDPVSPFTERSGGGASRHGHGGAG